MSPCKVQICRLDGLQFLHHYEIFVGPVVVDVFLQILVKLSGMEAARSRLLLVT